MKITNSNKDSCEIILNDIIRIDHNGKSVFVTGTSLIHTLMTSEGWNTRALDAKTGPSHTISEILK
jgi:hypothetical protein